MKNDVHRGWFGELSGWWNVTVVDNRLISSLTKKKESER